MFKHFKIDDNPESIGYVTKMINEHCNREIFIMLSKISKDYDIDYPELKNIYLDTNKKFSLSGHIHLPPSKTSRCKARVWGNGYGNTQCKRKHTKEGFCNIHYSQYMACKSHNCERGINGLGACNSNDHKGLWLGTIDKPRPENDDKGCCVIKWKDSKKKTKKPGKYKKFSKYKKKLRKLVVIEDTIETEAKVEESSVDIHYDTIKIKLLEFLKSIDFDDPNIDNLTIFKRFELYNKIELKQFKKQIFEDINAYYDELIEKEFEEDSDTVSETSLYDIEKDLVLYYENDKTYYVHRKTNEIYDNPKSLNIIGCLLNNGKFEIF